MSTGHGAPSSLKVASLILLAPILIPPRVVQELQSSWEIEPIMTEGGSTATLDVIVPEALDLVAAVLE